MNTVICCDDNKAFCDLLDTLLHKYQEIYELEIVKFYDADSLLQFCTENKFDVIYLDIELGKQNGLRVAKKLKYLNPKALVVYISAYDDYYVDMVNAEPFRFIKKDATDLNKLNSDLEKTLSEAMNRLDNAAKFNFVFQRNEYTVDLSKVKYFHSVARTVHIYGNIDCPPYFYKKMDEVEKELKVKDQNFERISKSCIVNMNYVKARTKNQVVVDGKMLSVTSKYREDFMRRHTDIAYLIV